MSYFYYGTKEEEFNTMLIRDIEIESYPSIRARVFIGKKALEKNIFFPVEVPLLPLFAEKQLTLF